jgi:hypothetical protein
VLTLRGNGTMNQVILSCSVQFRRPCGCRLITPRMVPVAVCEEVATGAGAKAKAAQPVAPLGMHLLSPNVTHQTRETAKPTGPGPCD